MLLSTAILFGLLIIFNAEAEEGLRGALHQVARFGLCFMLGVLAFFYRSSISTSWKYLPITGVLAFAMRGTFLEKHVFLVAIAHVVLVAGAINFGVLPNWTRKTDISYGTYIYGWPIQQSIVSSFTSIGVFGLASLSLVVVPVFGVLSWQFIEKPALETKRFLQPAEGSEDTRS